MATTRLLLVDRDPAVASTNRAFQSLGYETVIAPDLIAAVDIAHRYRPHVIVLECAPRLGGGPGSARLLREVLPEGVVILGFSVLDEPAGIREGELLDDYFVKPTPVRCLDARIQELLGGRGVAAG